MCSDIVSTEIISGPGVAGKRAGKQAGGPGRGRAGAGPGPARGRAGAAPVHVITPTLERPGGVY